MDTESLAITRESRLKFCNITLCLAYQSFGVVYGELSTAPIFVYKSTFSGRLRFHEEDDEIFGVLSMILWTLAIIPLCKYIIFVLGADDSGEGGTFALYSLLCRHTKVGLLGASHASYDDMPAYNSGFSSRETKASSFPKDFFDKHRSSRILLLLVVLLSTSMVIGEGVLTPSISAVYGIKIKATGLHDNYIVLVACVILVGLFALQHCGTQRVGFLFAPIVAWLLCISVVGIYNIIHWNPHVVSALSPYYIYNFFKKAGKDGWSSLGRIVLCITGVEAMFADLGHFSQLPIRVCFSFHLFIFMLVSSVGALRCFPHVKIIHTSNQIHGQIYIPEVNWILMIMCLSVTIGFRDMIGNAYGLAVVTVMFNTTCLMFLVIIMIWKCNVLLLYFSACLAKIHDGGWLSLTFSFLILSVIMAQNLGINRVPGIGLIYSDVISGVPPMFGHFVTNFPAFHQILVFVTLRPAHQTCPPEYLIFRCIVRYGYKDAKKDSYAFERRLMETKAEFLLRNCDDSGSSQSEVRFGGVRCSQELEKVEAAKEAGLAYMMGNTSIIASDTSSI
ncbi:hypothetical protein I3843_10G106100 [Carya illinoinensis]|nr:hypothetical protein I3843_10G106100 [Carya illinoinensis]